MDLTQQPAGFALQCDPGGRILRVIRDELGLFGSLASKQMLTDWVDAASVDKTRLFLSTVRDRQAAFDWELNVALGGQITPLYFVGSLSEGGLLIIGAKTRNGMARLYEELMLISNEQVNTLRAVMKEQVRLLQTQTERDGQLYDELTRVNNELATTQRELFKKNMELERLSREKNQFLGMAAHDLRNPLGVILVYSQFLLDEAGPVLTEKQREFLTIIQSSSEFMLRLINDLLDISKIESGRLELDLQPTDIAALVRRNVALNGVLAEKKRITLSCETDSGLPIMQIDPGKVEQVLNNLISNALKFSPSGAHVDVCVGRRGQTVRISVQDQGPGIPAAELSKLFKPFQRTSVRSTAGEKSTGLGLAIARRIVAGHGGEISVESQVGRGSTFSVTLPLPEAATQVSLAGLDTTRSGLLVTPGQPQGAAPTMAEQTSAVAPRGLHILLVEDSPFMQKVAAALLEKQGHSVIVASNGQEAVAAVSKEPFDLVLMDVEMPLMDGVQATALIRSREVAAEAHLPIIGMTGHSAKGEIARFLEAGMDACLTKPIQINALIEAISRVQKDKLA